LIQPWVFALSESARERRVGGDQEETKQKDMHFCTAATREEEVVILLRRLVLGRKRGLRAC